VLGGDFGGGVFGGAPGFEPGLDLLPHDSPRYYRPGEAVKREKGMNET